MACTVVLICGPPACGKSELIRSLESQVSRSTSLVFDEKFSVEEQKQAVLEEDGFKNLRERFLRFGREILDEARVRGPNAGDEAGGTRASSAPHVVMVEDNFYLRSMRYKWFQEVRERELSFCIVFLTVSVEECVRRNRQRVQPVPETMIREQFSKLELPDQEEYFWEKFSLVKPSPEIQNVLNLISTARAAPFKKLDLERRSEDLEEARQQTKASKLHSIDLAFRRSVSVLVKDAPPADREAIYSRLSGLKPSVMSSEEILESGGALLDAHVLSYLKKRLEL